MGSALRGRCQPLQRFSQASDLHLAMYIFKHWARCRRGEQTRRRVLPHRRSRTGSGTREVLAAFEQLSPPESRQVESVERLSALNRRILKTYLLKDKPSYLSRKHIRWWCRRVSLSRPAPDPNREMPVGSTGKGVGHFSSPEEVSLNTVPRLIPSGPRD
jgi:hypothetical protein